MIDYSLPVAKRTRTRRALAGEEHLERRKKRKKKNRADSASANNRGQVSSDRFGEFSKKVNTSENCSINRSMKSEPGALPIDGDDESVEEIDGSTFGREGGDSVTVVASQSPGLKNVKKFSTCLNGGIVDIIDLEDDEEEEGFDSVNSNCSISKSAAVGENGDFVCFDVDNEDGSSGLISCGKEKNALEISPNKSMGGSNSGGLYRAEPAARDREKTKEKNALGGSNSGGSYRAEPEVGNRAKNKENNVSGGSNSGGSYRADPTVGDREESKECFSDDDDGVEKSIESGASSSEEDNDASSDGTYELEKSEESSSESSSSQSGKSHRCYSAGTKSRRERRKRVKIFEGGVRRRAYGLDIFHDFDKDEHNSNCKNEDVKVDEKLNYFAIAQRTRSRSNPRVTKINTDLGTVSQPLCIDEEESDFQCDEKELDSSSRHDSTDSHDDTTDDENFKNQSGDKISERRTWSSEKKTQVNSQSGDSTNKVECSHGGSKLRSSESVPRMNKHNLSQDSEDFQKAHPKNCHEFDKINKKKGCSASKVFDVYNILVDSIIADKELPLDELVPPMHQVSEG